MECHLQHSLRSSQTNTSHPVLGNPCSFHTRGHPVTCILPPFSANLSLKQSRQFYSLWSPPTPCGQEPAEAPRGSREKHDPL